MYIQVDHKDCGVPIPFARIEDAKDFLQEATGMSNVDFHILVDCISKADLFSINSMDINEGTTVYWARLAS